MVGLSKKLEEKRAELARLIERKAFDAYVRHGAVPDALHRLADTAAYGQKFLDLCAGLSTKALPEGRPTTHYTWRTAGDDRVRHAHAVLEGQVFAWTNAPPEGHPGAAPNCRCSAEPYYGNPALPDAFLQLQSERRVSSNPAELWAASVR
ncbi:MAG: phage minor head protein [Devosia sp.]